MQKLYVLYDRECELCCRLKEWILAQRSWICIEVLAAGSERARQFFPELEQIASKGDLTVISDDGAVYLNNNAWIMVLYALVDYRDWAIRLSNTLLAPLARQAFAAFSKNRLLISKWLNASDESVSQELRNFELEPCVVKNSPQVVPTIREYLQ